MAFYAHFTAIFAYLNTVFAKVTFGTDNCAVLAEVATVAFVSISFHIARIASRADFFVLVTINAKQMVAAFTIAETFYTTKALFADSVFIIPTLSAIGASQVIF